MPAQVTLTDDWGENVSQLLSLLAISFPALAIHFVISFPYRQHSLSHPSLPAPLDRALTQARVCFFIHQKYRRSHPPV